MPRTPTRKPAAARTLVTLAEVQKDPARYQDTVIWMATEELLQLSHPDNPRLHDPEGDIPEIFKSLRDFGWQGSYVTLNPVTGLITGGHGRVLAAEMGMKLTEATFAQQWKRWIGVDPDRQKVVGQHKPRFSPEYWQACPVAIPPCLTDADQKSAMVRLNNQALDGRDDREKMASILQGMDAPRQQLAAWEPSQVANFVAQVQGRVEIVDDGPDPGEGYTSPGSNLGSGQGDYQRGDGYHRNPEDRRIPVRLYMDEDELSDYNTCLKLLAAKFGIDASGESRYWNTRIVLRALGQASRGD
jgi:hypothetical protein